MYKKCKMYSSSSRWKISIRYLTWAFGSQKIINFLKKWTCQLIFASLKRFCLIVDNLEIIIEIQYYQIQFWIPEILVLNVEGPR